MAYDPLPEIDYSKLSTEELLQLEKKYRFGTDKLNALQMAKKILINSMYGALGNASFRYFDVKLASSVTTSGQHAIKWIERKLNELIDMKTGISKDRIVLIDTDSVVLDLQDIVDKYCPKDVPREAKLKFIDNLGEQMIHPYIAASYQELADYMNAFQQKMKMKRENVINAMVSVAAKSYVMEVYNSEGVQYTLKDPYMKIMGLLLVKSSTPAVIRQALKDALPIMLHQNESDMQNYISKVKKDFNNFSIEEIAFPRGITNLSNFDKKLLQQYVKNGKLDKKEREVLLDKMTNDSPVYIKGTPIHVRGSLIYNDLIDKFGLGQQRKKIGDGDKVKFIYLKTPNPIGEDCIAFQETFPNEFGLNKYIDYNKMFEKTFVQAIEKMITPLNWKTENESFLGNFFM